MCNLSQGIKEEGICVIVLSQKGQSRAALFVALTGKSALITKEPVTGMTGGKRNGLTHLPQHFIIKISETVKRSGGRVHFGRKQKCRQ